MKDEILKELAEKLPDLLSTYNYNPNGADYICQFCHSRPKYNNEEIKHNPDCLGIKLAKELEIPV